eukprot:Seg5684.2 transcript_id=Seg5684.2/GoldUCD/mRNA.D3Y31 product="PiggyBac transposable element-derived protein 4" protein_id=Seg5684.2/GoldUCD/D3Y31
MEAYFEQLSNIFGSSGDESEFLGFTNEELWLHSDIENLSESEHSDSVDGESDDVVEQNFTNDLTHILVHEFTGPKPGPTKVLSAEEKEMDFLNLLFPENMYELVAEQMNLYASQKLLTKADPPWQNTSPKEIKGYFGIRLFMAIKNLPETKMYWSDDVIFGGDRVKLIMPRNRFDKISQYLHVNDRSKMPGRDDPDFDKLFLVRPIVDVVKTKCLENYKPHKECAVDEAMIAFRGCVDFRQYLPAKPTKYGIKVWM